MSCPRQPYYYSGGTDGGLTAGPGPGPRSHVPPGAYEATRERLGFRAFR
jgi:hypothetical protein